MSTQPGPQHRVLFQTPGEEKAEEEPPQRRLGKLTVKYNRKDLQKRLDIEEWIDGQLHLLFDCEEEDIPELEIDMDELLDLSDAEQRAKLHSQSERVHGFPFLFLQDLLQDCDKPKEDFIDGLLYRMKGLRKMSLKK
uniref:Protein phosphatase 1 regulatory subunit 14B n=1 Tax=Oncorhynchus tshawytscha TaxID=74940 RepID=A0A8C8BYE7_ONCTS